MHITIIPLYYEGGPRCLQQIGWCSDLTLKPFAVSNAGIPGPFMAAMTAFVRPINCEMSSSKACAC